MAIYNAIMNFKNWMWGLPVLLILIGGGIWLTIACDFVQIKHFGFAMKKTIIATIRGDKDKDKNKVSGYQAVTACLANTIGTGNIVGVGSAIALGGPGAVFWMWVVGFVAMCLKYCEAVLGVHTRIKGEDGRWKGGASHYLGQVWKPLGIIWSFCCVFGLAIACGTHTGSVASAASTLGVPSIVSTVIICVMVIILILGGGLKLLVRITEKMVPFMAILYVGTGLIVILANIGNLIPALASILSNAFTGTAATGGFAGAALSAAIKNGCARGAYSSDAGNGGASILHSQADVDDPVEQGMWGIFEVFVDTIIVCSFTALVILCTGVWTSGDPGSMLAINAFGTIGIAGRLIASIGLIWFATSPVLALTTMQGIVSEDMFGKGVRYVAQLALLICCFIGGTIGVDAALPWVDISNMLLIVVNVSGMVLLSKTLRRLTLDYFSKTKTV